MTSKSQINNQFERFWIVYVRKYPPADVVSLGYLKEACREAFKEGTYVNK